MLHWSSSLGFIYTNGRIQVDLKTHGNITRFVHGKTMILDHCPTPGAESVYITAIGRRNPFVNDSAVTDHPAYCGVQYKCMYYGTVYLFEYKSRAYCWEYGLSAKCLTGLSVSFDVPIITATVRPSAHCETVCGKLVYATIGTRDIIVSKDIDWQFVTICTDTRKNRIKSLCQGCNGLLYSIHDELTDPLGTYGPGVGELWSRDIRAPQPALVGVFGGLNVLTCADGVIYAQTWGDYSLDIYDERANALVGCVWDCVDGYIPVMPVGANV